MKMCERVTMRIFRFSITDFETQLVVRLGRYKAVTVPSLTNPRLDKYIGGKNVLQKICIHF